MSRAANRRSLPTVEIHQRVLAGVSTSVIRGWARRWASELNYRGATVSIAIVGPAEIRRLNARGRGKHQPTNVLSFALDAVPGPTKTSGGEIVLCPAVVRQEYRQYRRTYRQHFLLLLQHGLIHLTGRDHERPAELKSWNRLERKLSLPR